VVSRVKFVAVALTSVLVQGSDYDDDPDGPRSRAVSRVRGRKEQLKQEAKANGQ
jgi:hypothetical protein